MTLTNLAISQVSARYFSKLRRASKEFKETTQYTRTLVKVLSKHVNGNPQEPLRKMDSFVEHNSASELALIGKLSETARFLQDQDGISRELCHLVPLSRGSTIKKVNNVSNMVILTRVANQIIGKRGISREDAEVVDRLVLSRQIDKARAYAAAHCF